MFAPHERRRGFLRALPGAQEKRQGGRPAFMDLLEAIYFFGASGALAASAAGAALVALTGFLTGLD
jgi:hypothetical protein